MSLDKVEVSKKATKFEKKTQIFSVTSKQVGDFFSNFVAFSECLNFA